MDNYLLLKLIHILAAVIVAGTGTGIAFFMFMAVQSKDKKVIQITTRYVVLADWLFTAPAVIIQLMSGLALMHLLHYSFSSWWFIVVISLFIFIGICWIPVILIQYKLRALSNTPSFEPESNLSFKRLFKYWVSLGIPAFISIIVMFWLMVFKPLTTM
ncbi:DUF2269 family protein [Aliikangiella sp. IMCC44359]|uniref:DUF2269 family protein n=1 Tax=Aliikangiella sp. IMCC44359 TaxID=3459125 RepID=UPI00403A9089